MKRLILVGSPRTNGRCAHLAEEIFETNIEEYPEDELFLVPISEIEVGPCIGCGACKKTSEVILKDADGAEVAVQKHRCVFDDDMQTMYDILDEADEVIVVSPVYFSGTPGPFKCLLDRLQPYFWSDVRFGEKRPATLHVIGEGGDPHGYNALVSEVRSALAVAGFKLQRVLDWVGKIDENGTITSDATEIQLGERASQGGAGGADGAGGAGVAADEAHDLRATSASTTKPRPKLNLSEKRPGNTSGNSGKSNRPGKPSKSSKSSTNKKQSARAKGKGGRRG